MAVETTRATHLDEASRLHAAGVSENSAGRPIRAAPLLRRALKLIGDAQPADDEGAHRAFLRARVLLSLAATESELHGVEHGLATLAQADESAALSSEPSIRVVIGNQRGLLLLRAGRTRQAVEQFNAAERWFAGAPPLEQCNVLLNRGALYLDRVELAAARRDLRRCQRIARANDLRVLDRMATHNLGYLEFLAGNLPLSLEMMQGAAALDVDVSEGILLLDRARVLVEAGLSREAERSLREAGEVFARDRLGQDMAEVDLEIATSAYSSGDLIAARAHAVRARDRFRRRGNERWHRRAELLVLQIDLRRGRSPGRLRTLSIDLAERFRAEGQHAEARLATFLAAEALLDSGQAEDAYATAMQVGPASSADPIAARVHTRYLRARLELGRGNRNLAAGEVRRGLDDLTDYQARFGSIDLQTASAVHGRRLAELGLRIALDTGQPAAVFAAVERGRANSSRIRAVQPPHDEQTATMLAELRQTVETLRAVPSTSPAAARLHRRRGSLERRIAARGWSLPGAVRPSSPISLGELQAALARWDSALVSYFVAGDELRGLVATSGSTALISLGDYRQVETLVRRVRADFDLLAHRNLAPGVRASATGSLARGLSGLDELLLAPMGVDGRRVLVTPTAVLSAVPWGSLPSRNGVPTSVSRSATAWHRALPARTGPAGPPVVAAFAGPGLPRSASEVATVGRRWPNARTFVAGAADRGSFTEAFARADLVHVAAHGKHEPQSPLFSSLRLVDGLLFAYELDNSLGFPAHVVLSACDLGLATIRPGDETLGLTSVLLQLGTRSVVSGVARVGDDAAHEVMVEYHRQLALGADSALALAAATTAGPGEQIGAPFVCFGSHWAAAPTLPAPRPRSPGRDALGTAADPHEPPVPA